MTDNGAWRSLLVSLFTFVIIGLIIYALYARTQDAQAECRRRGGAVIQIHSNPYGGWFCTTQED